MSHLKAKSKQIIPYYESCILTDDELQQIPYTEGVYKTITKLADGNNLVRCYIAAEIN